MNNRKSRSEKVLKHWPLYYKIFNSHNCWRNAISQSVPTQSNNCGQEKEPTIIVEYGKALYFGRLQPCLQILVQGGSDWNWQTLQLIKYCKNLPQKALQYSTRSLLKKIASGQTLQLTKVVSRHFGYFIRYSCILLIGILTFCRTGGNYLTVILGLLV